MGRAEDAGPAGRGLIRPPAVAGAFYPADPDELARTVDGLLDRAAVDAEGPRPSALVVPHAGYPYSGPTAAAGYACVRDLEARRVVVLGPAHFVGLAGMAVPRAEAWRTPLGTVELDGELRALAAAAGAAIDDEPHAPEHAIEVQLPFLQRALAEGWTFLPVAVGSTPPEPVADLLDPLWGNVDLLVVSTDLSHYLDETTARRIDRATAEAVLRLDLGGVGRDAACGGYALRGLLAFAARHDLAPRLLRLSTSADASGDPSSVVGYGAFAFG